MTLFLTHFLVKGILGFLFVRASQKFAHSLTRRKISTSRRRSRLAEETRFLEDYKESLDSRIESTLNTLGIKREDEEDGGITETITNDI